ncbi:MAG: hypothetical protein KatS3mg102_1968 [Planctomycetota bacterium]|nr:MAG: hypothetical protein KatS3mg102_1968 [Planctomycetota bacterium]
MALLAEEGLEALTIQRLARRMDVAVGLLYRYFPSKEELLLELQLRELGELAERFTRELERVAAHAAARHASAGIAALAQVLGAARLYRQLAARAPERFALIGRVLASPHHVLPPAQARRVLEAVLPLWRAVAARLEAAAEAGVLAPGPGLPRTVTLWAALHGVLQLGKLARLEPRLLDARRRAAELVLSLLMGWGARAQALAEAEQLLASLPRRPGTPAGGANAAMDGAARAGARSAG